MCVVVGSCIDRPQLERSFADLAVHACRQSSPLRSAMSAPVPQRGSRFAQLAHDLREALLGAFTVSRNDATLSRCTQEQTTTRLTLAGCVPLRWRELLARVGVTVLSSVNVAPRRHLPRTPCTDPRCRSLSARCERRGCRCTASVDDATLRPYQGYSGVPHIAPELSSGYFAT